MRAVTISRVERQPAVTDPILLLGFSGWGDAGGAATTAVSYVSEQARAERFAVIEGEEFLDFTVERPLVRLDAQFLRRIEWPAWEFRIAEPLNLILLTGPEPHLRWKAFAESVLEIARGVGVRQAAMLGGFLADVLYTDPVPLTGFASDPAMLDRLRVASTGYQGPTGIVGVLADAFRRESIPVLSLWAAIPHYVAASPNPRGALALLLKLREWTALPIDFAPLEAAASAFQAQLLQAVESDANLSKYIRALKKQETSH